MRTGRTQTKPSEASAHQGSVTCGIGAVAGLEEHHRDRGVDLVGGDESGEGGVVHFGLSFG